MFKSLKLFIAMVITICSLLLICTNATSATEKTTTSTKTLAKDEKIIVYYFYSKPRCISCKKIESYTQKAVADLKNPKVQYITIDLDNSKNKTYSEKYKLFTKSVVLSKQKSGKETKWRNLAAIWTKIGNEKEFKTYIITEIKNLGG